MVKFQFHGRELHLLYNGNLLYEIQEKYGDEANVFTLCQDNTRAAFLAACNIITMMCEQGELLRRYLGYDPAETPKLEWFRTCSSYGDVGLIKNAIFRTAAHDVDSGVVEDEIDLGLLELEASEKKK